MPIEPSSLEAYERLMPVIAQRHQQILAWMIFNFNRPDMPPPWTANEFKHLMTAANYQANEVWKRLREMERLGIVVQLPKRQCRVRPGHALEWTLAPRVPLPSQVQNKQQAVKELDADLDVGLRNAASAVRIALRRLRTQMLNEVAPARYISSVTHMHSVLDRALNALP